MVYRVVATKLTEEEHSKLLDICNKEGCTPATFIKKTILEKIVPLEKSNTRENKTPKTLKELIRAMRIQDQNKS